MRTGHGSVRAWARSNEREEAHLVVAVAWPEMAGSDGGKPIGGWLESGVSGSNARGHGKACARARWVPVSSRNTVTGSGEQDDGCGDGHERVGGGQKRARWQTSYGALGS